MNNQHSGTKGANRAEPDDVLIRVRNLKKHFPIRRGIFRRPVSAVQAVDGVTFDIKRGETLSLVGERGCGKSTVGRAMLRLLEPTAGDVFLEGQSLGKLNREKMRRSRRHMQMIFTDPYASLNPRMTVANIIGEPMEIQNIGSADARKKQIQKLLKLVGLNPYVSRRHPYEFSGGQRLRIGIARALSTNPAFIIVDEPTAALDVSIQPQIVDLFDQLKAELGLTYLFIARDLSTVRHISDRVAVMYLGRIVELGAADEIYHRPLHPYTQALLSNIPVGDSEKEARRQHIRLDGDAPDPVNPPPACRFQPRCGYATEICGREDPLFRDLSSADSPHMVACHHAEQFL